MLYITTTILPATGTRSTRLVASGVDLAGRPRRLITRWDFTLNNSENHENAALNLLGRHSFASTCVAKVATSPTKSGLSRVHIYEPACFL
jgi:hypothetical protein